jgi:hypothetical protein
MRLVENNVQRRGNMPPDVATIHDTFGRYNRARNIHTPQYIRNIEEEPDMSTPNTHLPALPTQHRPKASKHSLFDTPDVLQTKGETPKPTPPTMPGTPMEKSTKSSHEMQHSGKRKLISIIPNIEGFQGDLCPRVPLEIFLLFPFHHVPSLHVPLFHKGLFTLAIFAAIFFF